MNGNVYLGCVQNDFKPSADMVAAKTKMVKELLDNVHAERPAVSSDDLSTANNACGGSSSATKRGVEKPKGKPESTDEAPIMTIFQDKNPHHNVKGWQYSMKGHAEQCVENTVSWRTDLFQASRKFHTHVLMTTCSHPRTW